MSSISIWRITSDQGRSRYPMEIPPSDCEVTEISRLPLAYDRVEESDDEHTQQDKKKDQGDPCLPVVV